MEVCLFLPELFKDSPVKLLVIKGQHTGNLYITVKATGPDLSYFVGTQVSIFSSPETSFQLA